MCRILPDLAQLTAAQGRIFPARQWERFDDIMADQLTLLSLLALRHEGSCKELHQLGICLQQLVTAIGMLSAALAARMGIKGGSYQPDARLFAIDENC